MFRPARWYRLGLVAVTAALLAVAATGCSRPAAPPPPSSQPTYCQGTVNLSDSSGTHLALQRAKTVRFTARVGDELVISASGPCGSEVHGTSQREAVMAADLHKVNGLKAVTAGSALVVLTYPACDNYGGYGKGPDGCGGGVSGFGNVIVTVTE